MNIPQEQIPPIEIRNPAGLSLKVDIDSRDPDSFQQLDNFDHYIDGSIRKINPPVQYNNPNSPFSTGILNFIEYRFTDASALSIIGVGADGNLYDVTSGAKVGSLLAFVNVPLSAQMTVPPFLAVLPGVLIPYNFRSWLKNTAYIVGDAIIKYSAVDGNLYIFECTVPGNTAATESAYPASGNVVDNSVTWTNRGLQSSNLFQCNYLIIIVPGYQPMKWDSSTGTVTQVGVSAPEIPANVKPGTISPNLDGYSPTVGNFYAYTFFNPRTLHESSPSPITAQTQFWAVDQALQASTPGSFLPVIPVIAGAKTDQQRSYQQIGIEVPTGSLTPAIGQGFTHLRFYRTKDGGATFFLLTQLYDASGNCLTNSDGSVSIASMVTGITDYAPLPTPQSVQAMSVVYEGFGAINLIPAPDTLDPNYWIDKSSGKIYVAEACGQNGDNAFEYDGTGAASGPLSQRSSAIPGTSAVSYTMQVYIDATQQASGNIGMKAMHWDQTALLNCQQINGQKGYVTVTGNLGGGNVHIWIHEDGVVNNGQSVLWSNPVLQKGTAILPTGYPTLDAALVTPSPTVESANPPPIAEWGAVYQSRDRKSVV